MIAAAVRLAGQVDTRAALAMSRSFRIPSLLSRAETRYVAVQHLVSSQAGRANRRVDSRLAPAASQGARGLPPPSPTGELHQTDARIFAARSHLTQPASRSV